KKKEKSKRKSLSSMNKNKTKNKNKTNKNKNKNKNDNNVNSDNIDHMDNMDSIDNIDNIDYNKNKYNSKNNKKNYDLDFHNQPFDDNLNFNYSQLNTSFINNNSLKKNSHNIPIFPDDLDQTSEDNTITKMLVEDINITDNNFNFDNIKLSKKVNLQYDTQMCNNDFDTNNSSNNNNNNNN
ncbi:conserved protein, unknown function, partial [Plasmodium gaboni]